MQEGLLAGSAGPVPELTNLWALGGLISWAQYYTRHLEKAQLE